MHWWNKCNQLGVWSVSLACTLLLLLANWKVLQCRLDYNALCFGAHGLEHWWNKYNQLGVWSVSVSHWLALCCCYLNKKTTMHCPWACTLDRALECNQLGLWSVSQWLVATTQYACFSIPLFLRPRCIVFPLSLHQLPICIQSPPFYCLHSSLHPCCFYTGCK